jgi:hypothetical protein
MSDIKRLMYSFLHTHVQCRSQASNPTTTSTQNGVCSDDEDHESHLLHKTTRTADQLPQVRADATAADGRMTSVPDAQ